MNIFVLCSGRTASTTFTKASSYFIGYTASHEINVSKIFDERCSYPDNHIEVDNRLSWFLGQLDKRYGNTARYVVLVRDKDKVSKSYLKRWYLSVSIVRAFSTSILMSVRRLNDRERLDRCLYYAQTIELNIELFLKDKSNVFYFDLESPKSEFQRFVEWTSIDYDMKGLEVWDEYHNQNKSLTPAKFMVKASKKIIRILASLPSFIRWT